MSIQVTCPSCQAKFNAKDEWAGRKGQCPRCKAEIVVPRGAAAAPARPPQLPAQTAVQAVQELESYGVAAAEPAPVAAAPSPPPAAVPAAPQRPAGVFRNLQEEILGGFQGNIAKVNVGVTYHLGLLLSVLIMVALPLIYVALIALACYGVYYHAVNHTALLEMGSGRGRLMAVLVYVAPMVIGAILVFFMTKPLFARPADEGRRRSLTRQGEPLLFAFVDRLCQAVGAPAPKRIDADCQVNASAGFRRGMFSMFGHDLVLTIGLPLVAGLTLQQFAGVLAHEFGHFSQGAGMRLTYIVRSINAWFLRVVYERDQWDEWLQNSTDELDLRIGWVLWLSKLFVWLTRQVLFLLMLVGHAVSGFMLRQMEFDADRHEARLAGSEAFESTARRLMVLGVAWQGALADVVQLVQAGKLGDNLPKLILHNVEQIPRDVHVRMNAAQEKARTGLFDTHPCDKDRIASAKREAAAGVFRSGRPAADLFVHYDALAKNVTWDFYRGLFGDRVKPQDMQPIESLLSPAGPPARPA